MLTYTDYAGDTLRVEGADLDGLRFYVRGANSPVYLDRYAVEHLQRALALRPRAHAALLGTTKCAGAL